MHLLGRPRGYNSLRGLEMSDTSNRVQLVQVLARHQGMVKAYAYAILRDFHLAEDVFQEVAVILAERWESVPSGEGLIPWLREATRRKSLETRRKLHRATPTLSEEVLEQVGAAFGPPERDAERRRSLQDVLSQCVGKLMGVARQVIEARWGEGLSCEQIASRIGRSVQGVYAILKRARLLLVQCVDRSLVSQG
jgi:RNA polymerase sigma-70 factor (ECF subfamily)